MSIIQLSGFVIEKVNRFTFCCDDVDTKAIGGSMSVTISDVAKKAGVSPATVSKYLNRKTVSPKSYIRIEEAIQELNYQVNDFARGLRTNTSQMIGLLVPGMNNIFTTSLFKETERRLTEYDYSLVLCSYNNDSALFVEKVTFMRQRRVDGAIVLLGGQMTDSITEGLRELQSAGIPFVLVNGLAYGIEADAVLADNAQAIYDCVTLLLNAGHRRIGMVMAPKSSYNVHERKAGFRKAYEDANLTVDETLLYDFGTDKEWPTEVKAQVLRFITDHPDLTALILPGYRLTIAGIHALHQVGKRIGKDMALIGYDCDVINDAFNPSITYIRLPADAIAANAIEVLIDSIKNKGKNSPRLIRVSAQKVDGHSVFQI